MFSISENFSLYDKEKQPYNMEIIKNSSFTHKHGCVKESGYAIICSGNNCMIHSPELKDFDLTATIRYGRVNLRNTKWRFYPIGDAEWMIFFGYDKDTRKGTAVSFRTCVADGSLTARLLEVGGIYRNVICEQRFDNKILNCDDFYKVNISVKDNKITGTFADCDFAFEADVPRGRVGFMTANFPGEFFIREFELKSDEKFDEEVLFNKKFTIPMMNGGKVPYELTLKVIKIGETLYLDQKFYGGCSSNPVDDTCGSWGQYGVEWDRFTNPRIIIKNKSGQQEYYIKNGVLVVHDPNIHWEFLEECVSVDHLPFEKRSGLMADLWNEDTEIIFTYDHLGCKGYAMQQGGAEFRYNVKGEPVYAGKPICDGLMVARSFGTEAFKLVPDCLPEMDKVKKHFELNHYFTIDESLDFNLELYTNRPIEGLTVKAELTDAFGDEVLAVADAERVSVKDSLEKGITCAEYRTSHKSMPHGVYRMMFRVYSEGVEVYSKHSTFEVIDKNAEISPAKASGVPFLYSTPNEDIGLERDAFDIWNPMPDCDHGHYFTCMAYTPSVGMKKMTPEVQKAFKRQWFVWLGGRTEPDYTNLEKFRYALENADYIQYPDCCGCNIWRMPSAMAREFLNDFLDENPQCREKLSFDKVDNNFTKQQYEEILSWNQCREAWFTYANFRMNPAIVNWDKKHFAPYTDNFRRTGYGPINTYTIPYVTYYTMRHFGREANDKIKPSDFFGGYCQFEDYPYSCSYKSYRAALGLSSIKLWDKDLVMYPEMYQNGSGMCPDGAVAFANPPYASFICPTYFHGTQVLEAAFGTPIRRDNGYDYWRDYGFMARDFPAFRLNALLDAWKYVKRHEPKQPVKTIGFVTDFPYEDTRYESAFTEPELKDGLIYNISEEGCGFLFGCAREAGQPAGSVLKLETIKNLDASEVTMLVIPSLRGVDKEIVDAIRKLYENGVSLFATSYIDGLEDLFGVELDDHDVVMATITDGEITESVYPIKNEFRYKSNGASTVVWANGNESAIFTNERTALLNASVSHLALDAFVDRIQTGRECISEMIKMHCRNIINELSNGPVYAKGCGLAAFVDKNNEVIINAVNYAPYDQDKLYDLYPASIYVEDLNVSGAESEHELKCFYENGKLIRIELDLLPHQYAVIKLIK